MDRVLELEHFELVDFGEVRRDQVQCTASIEQDMYFVPIDVHVAFNDTEAFEISFRTQLDTKGSCLFSRTMSVCDLITAQSSRCGDSSSKGTACKAIPRPHGESLDSLEPDQSARLASSTIGISSILSKNLPILV